MKTYQLVSADVPHLYTKFRKGGSSQYVFRFRLEKTITERSLGLKQPTRAEAISAAGRLNEILRRGEDPFGAVVKQQTFGDVWNGYVKTMSDRGQWTKDAKGEVGTAKTWNRYLDKDLASIAKLRFSHPSLEQRALDALAPYWGTKKGDDLVDAVARVFRIAIRKKLWKGPNPVSKEAMTDINGVGRDTRSVKDGGDVEHVKSLEYNLVPDVIVRLVADYTSPRAKGCNAQAAHFGIVTTARSGNIIMCRKQDIDRKARTWTIAAGGDEWGLRMKNGAEHTFYLSDQEMAIIDARWNVHPDCDWLFSNNGKTPLPAGALNEKITKPREKGGLGLAGQATMHGMRASFGDWVKQNHTAYADIADAMLAHAEGKKDDKVKKAYQRNDAVHVMTELGRLWGLHCAGIDGGEVQPSNVVKLRLAS